MPPSWRLRAAIPSPPTFGLRSAVTVLLVEPTSPRWTCSVLSSSRSRVALRSSIRRLSRRRWLARPGSRTASGFPIGASTGTIWVTLGSWSSTSGWSWCGGLSTVSTWRARWLKRTSNASWVWRRSSARRSALASVRRRGLRCPVASSCEALRARWRRSPSTAGSSRCCCRPVAATWCTWRLGLAQGGMRLAGDGRVRLARRRRRRQAKAALADVPIRTCRRGRGCPPRAPMGLEVTRCAPCPPPRPLAAQSHRKPQALRRPQRRHPHWRAFGRPSWSAMHSLRHTHRLRSWTGEKGTRLSRRRRPLRYGLVLERYLRNHGLSPTVLPRGNSRTQP